MILAHEEGHIYCNHLTSTPVLGREVIEEHEANEFAHYLLNQGLGQQINRFVQKHRVGTIAVAIAAACILIASVAYCNVRTERRYYGDFYITTTGSKYHEKDCIFIKHKDNVERLTVEQFESGEYEPCDICLPHGSK